MWETAVQMEIWQVFEKGTLDLFKIVDHLTKSVSIVCHDKVVELPESFQTRALD